MMGWRGWLRLPAPLLTMLKAGLKPHCTRLHARPVVVTLTQLCTALSPLLGGVKAGVVFCELGMFLLTWWLPWLYLLLAILSTSLLSLTTVTRPELLARTNAVVARVWQAVITLHHNQAGSAIR